MAGSSTLDARAAFGIDVAREAGRLALDYYENRDKLDVTMKGAQDFLTVADGAVEALIRKRVAEAFPGDGVLGEEAGGKAAERLWIVDPIDGTANFARAEPHWCISLGYVEAGVPKFGVILAPAINEEFAATLGRGATRNGKPIQVAPTPDMKTASIEIGWSARRPIEAYVGMVDKVMRAGASAKRSASGALGLAWVAAGRTDGYLEAHINSWDVAAGLVIAREAGCVVNDFFAGDGLLSGNPILCATPALASTLADMMGLPRSALLATSIK